MMEQTTLNQITPNQIICYEVLVSSKLTVNSTAVSTENSNSSQVNYGISMLSQNFLFTLKAHGKS